MPSSNQSSPAHGATYGTPDTQFQVCAERSAKGTGRVYTIRYTVRDGSGNSAESILEVRVPLSAAAGGGA